MLRALLRPFSPLVRAIFDFSRTHQFAWFVLNRLLSMVVLLFMLGLSLFALMQLSPGDIVDNYIRQRILQQEGYEGEQNILDDELIEQTRRELGLDRPFYIQYFRWLRQLFVERDLGRSLISRAPILFLIRTRMINSLILNLISLVFLTIFSFALGIYFSSKVSTKVDVAATAVALFLHAMPSLLLLILLQLFGALSGLFPVTAYPNFPFQESPTRFVFSYAHHIFLPLLGAFLSGIGGTMRYIRSTMLDQLGKPYIFALYSRGIARKRVYLNHAFRNTLNPYITSSANIFAGLFSGSLILEIIFSYPGIGRLMFEALRQEDINLVLANTMFISALTFIGYVTADILLAVVDPRIRYRESK